MPLQTIQHLPDLVEIPYIQFTMRKKQFGVRPRETIFFSRGGKIGVPLRDAASKAHELGLDDGEISVLDGCGTKYAVVLKVDFMVTLSGVSSLSTYHLTATSSLNTRGQYKSIPVVKDGMGQGFQMIGPRS